MLFHHGPLIQKIVLLCLTLCRVIFVILGTRDNSVVKHELSLLKINIFYISSSIV